MSTDREISMDELRDRLRRGKEIVIGDDGRIETPSASARDSAEARSSPRNTTRLRDEEFAEASAVRITRTAHAQALATIKDAPDGVETGWIFLGDPERALITRCIPSGDRSRRSYAHFVRAADDVQRLLDEAVARGEGRYMGEGHLHPGNHDHPSGTDARTMQGIVRDDGYNAPIAYLAIAVRRPTIDGSPGMGMRMFRFVRDGSWGEVGWTLVQPEEAAAARTLAAALPAASGRWPQESAWRMAWRWIARIALHQPALWSALAARQSPVLGVEHLRGKRVLLVGAGSVGSQTGMFLVRAGVGHLTNLDVDPVEAVNLGRTAFTVRDIGRPKAEALARHMRAANPGVSVRPIVARTDDLSDEELVALIEAHDLILDATGAPASKFRLNALARNRRGAVYAAVYARASAGEVIYTVPGATPCLECVVGSVRRAQPANLAGAPDYARPGELHAEPALGVDIGHVAAAAAKVALALLARGTGSETERFVTDRAPVLFVGNDAGWIFDSPFESAWARCSRSPRCSCQCQGVGPIVLETGEPPSPATAP